MLRGCNIKKVLREGVIEKVKSEERLKGDEGMSQAMSGAVQMPEIGMVLVV